MKLSAPLVKSLLMAASIGLVVPIVAQTPRPTRPEQEVDEPEMKGVPAPWGGGTLALAIESNAFVLRFYDAEKKPKPVPAARSTVRWDSPQKAGVQRTVLNPEGAEALRSPALVRPPYAFTAHITLLSAEGDSLGVVPFDMRTHPAPR
ncbi:MAG TPA: hypothetical protein VHF69_06895 [Candidatus Synoicihabitans sp.]|nr:hypothetical protein [Candidatus Synoicihabitans sp.]